MRKYTLSILIFLLFLFINTLFQRYDIKLKGGISLGGSSWSEIWHSMPRILFVSIIMAIVMHYVFLATLKKTSNDISKATIRNAEKEQYRSSPKTSECRVCGYSSDTYPWGEDGVSPSYQICPCCGVQFGKEDRTLDAIKAYRGEWISSRSLICGYIIDNKNNSNINTCVYLQDLVYL
jgi:hypothetical protein